MAEKFNDIAAVVATRDYVAARSWYSRVIGRDPDLEPMAGVAEWQIAATAWLQLIEDPTGRASPRCASVSTTWRLRSPNSRTRASR